MNVFNHLKIGYKLAVGFGLCVLMIIGLQVYSDRQMVRLDALEDTSTQQAGHAMDAMRALSAGGSMYKVIAETEHKMDFVKAQAEWAMVKEQEASAIQAARDAATTPEEEAWVEQTNTYFDRAIQVFETQMLPGLQASKAMTPEILLWDSQINEYINSGQDQMENFASSQESTSAAQVRTFDKERDTIRLVSAVVTVVNVLFALLVASFISHNLNSGIRRLGAVVHGLSSGDLDQRVEVHYQDELGDLARGFNHMLDRLKGMIQSEQEQRIRLQNTIDQYMTFIGAVMQGRLSTRLALNDGGAEALDPLEVLGSNLNIMTGSFESVIAQIREAAENLTASSAEILAATTQQASGSSEQSAAIAQTTTTVDEVKVIGEQSVIRAQEVYDASNRTLEVSRGGQQAVQETIESMTRIKERVEGIAENILALSEQTQQIGEIIATVSSIASQSNMLALNASVEAARAGEHGKGFAVVAAEVRSLAEQSRAATAQVKAILQDIQKATNATVMATEEGTKVVDQGVRLAARSQEAIQQLSGVIDESAQRASQVVAGGRQQASGIEQIALAMQNINQAMVQSLASTRQAEKAAQDLNQLAYNLNDMVKRYIV